MPRQSTAGRTGSSMSGWDGPLDVVMQLDQQSLASAFGDAAPVGKHDHDLPSYPNSKSRTEFPRGGKQRLKTYLSHAGNWFVSYTRRKVASFKSAYIVIHNAYARIIDIGGNVSARRMDNTSRYTTKNATGTWIMAYQTGGEAVFSRYRRGYHIQGQGYIEKGLDNLMRQGGGKGIKVAWGGPYSGGPTSGG